MDKCYCSVDGTDCPINEPSPYSSTWYSHKLNSAGLRYDIAVSTRKARIVSVSGPCPASSHSDPKILRTGIKQTY